MEKKIIIEGSIPTLVAELAAKFGFDPKYAWAWLQHNHEELKDPTKCANCGSKMEAAVYTPDLIDALLVLKMAETIREKTRKGVPFTEANMVHVPTLNATDAMRHRTTRCGYLNYIKQPEKKAGTGYWLITSWGWALLRGERVPGKVIYFRGKKLERPEGETVVLSDLFNRHVDRVKAALARRKAVEDDYRSEIAAYNATDWAEYGKVQQGVLI